MAHFFVMQYNPHINIDKTTTLFTFIPAEYGVTLSFKLNIKHYPQQKI